MKALTSGGAGLHAGGTDLLGCLRDHVFDIKKMVSISGLKELEGIRKIADGGLRIGALTTIADVAENAVVKERYAAWRRPLKRWRARSSGTRARSAGTSARSHGAGTTGESSTACGRAGKNVSPSQGRTSITASSAADPASSSILRTRPRHSLPLKRRSASSARKERGRSPSRSFHVLPGVDARRETVLGPGEIVTEIVLPPSRGARSSYRKVRDRAAWDFALAGVALAIQLSGDVVSKARVVLSGAAPIPWRSKEAEQVLIGQKVDGTVASKAAEAALRNAQPLAQNGYKVPMFRALLEEELVAITRTT